MRSTLVKNLANLVSPSHWPNEVQDLLVRVRHAEAGTNQGAVNEHGSDLPQLFLDLRVARLILTRQLPYSAQEALDERRLRVDLQNPLLLGEVAHGVMHARLRSACGMMNLAGTPSYKARLLTHHLLDIGREAHHVGDDRA